MKNSITFFALRSSLRVSLWLLFGLISSAVMAQQFGQPTYFAASINSGGAGAEAIDVFFDDNCTNSIDYKVGYTDDSGMTWNETNGYVNNSPAPVFSPNIGGYTGSNYEQSIYKVSPNTSGYLSYMGYVDGPGAHVPYINTHIFDDLDANLDPITSIADILTSPVGNYTYVVGSCANAINLGGVTLPSGGAFLAKYNGGTALWGTMLPTGMNPLRLINQSNGTFVVLGTFSGTISLNGYTISNTGNAMFWAKFNGSGTCLGLTRVGTGTLSPKAAKVNANGEMYLTGYHGSGAVIAGTTLSGTGRFIAKCDSLGTALLGIHIGSTTGTNQYDADVDMYGNSYLITGNTTFSKYSLSNTLIWSKSISSHNPIISGTEPVLNGIGVDKKGNIGIAGRLSNLGGLAIDGVVYRNATNAPITESEGFFSLAIDPNNLPPTLSSNLATVCTGGTATLTFTAGTGNSNFTWQQSTNAGATWTNIAGYVNTTSTTYTTPALSTTTQYRVTYNSVACGASVTATVNVNVLASSPSLALSSSNNNFCEGGAATLTAVVSGIGGTTTYQWQSLVNNVWTNITGANAATIYFYSLTTTTMYKVITNTSGGGCVFAKNDSILITVKPKPNVVSTPASANILCAGGSVTLTASGANTYQWGSGISSTAATVTVNPTFSNTYTLTGIGTNGCSKSIYVPVNVNINSSPTITITQNNPQHCSGVTATFSVVPSNFTGFQWKKNGVVIAGATSSTYTTTSLVNNDVLQCQITTGQACNPTLNSTPLTVIVTAPNSLIVPTISINNGINDKYICSNGTLYFPVNTTFAGGSPIYQWKKNGVNVNNINASNVNNGDVITYELTSSLGCAIPTPVVSNPVTIHKNNAGGYGTYTCTSGDACLGDTVVYVALSAEDCDCDNTQMLYAEWWTYATANGNATSYVNPYTYILSPVNTPNYDVIDELHVEIDYNSSYQCSGYYNNFPATYIGTVPTFYYSNFTPTINITSTLLGNPCSSTTYLFTANGTGGGNGATYQWKINGQNAPNGIYKQFASASLQNGDIITCAMTSALSCASPAIVTSNAITVSGGIATLSLAANSICTGGTVNVNLTGGNAGATYTWQVSTNGGTTWANITGYVNTTNISFSNIPGSSRSYRVIVNDPICGGYTTAAVALTLVADPVLTVTPSNNNFCAGGNTTLSTVVTGGLGTNNYQWQQYIANVWTNIAGATGASFTSPNLSATTNYRANLTQSVSGCAASVISAITVKPLPNITTNPALPKYCVGGTVSISAGGGSNYSWSPTTGLSTATGSPVVASGTISTTYSLTGTGTNGCTKTIAVPVTVNQDPGIVVTGASSVCVGSTTTLTATTTGGAGTCTIQWQKSTNGTTWSSISGATGASYTTPAMTVNVYYRATYTCNGGGCSPAAASSSLLVSVVNLQPVLSLAQATICTGGTAVVNLTGGNAATTYTWQVSTNSGATWTNITGYVNTTSTTFSHVPGSSRSYQVIANDPVCGIITTNSANITLISDPVLTVTPSNNNFCAGGNTTLTSAITGGLGTNSYQWQQYISNVWTNIAGATGASYTASNVSATTNYRANLTQSVSGCAASTISAITVKPLPNITTSPAAPTYCVGGTVSISATGGSNYSWSPATGLSAATGSPVVASGTTSTTYSLTGTGTNGCAKTIAVAVTVKAEPSITVTGPTSVPTGTAASLSATPNGGSGTCTLQWQSSTNGTTWSSISGATAATYTTPAITGTKYYRATYTCNGSGCSPAGTSNVLTIIGIQQPTRLAEKVYDLTLYPNPASVNLTVSLSTTADEKADFIITDMLGKRLTQWEGKPENGIYENEISIENLSQGGYFLSVKIGERVMTQKFVKE